jgi:hypothetical protein
MDRYDQYLGSYYTRPAANRGVCTQLACQVRDECIRTVLQNGIYWWPMAYSASGLSSSFGNRWGGQFVGGGAAGII